MFDTPSDEDCRQEIIRWAGKNKARQRFVTELEKHFWLEEICLVIRAASKAKVVQPKRVSE